MHSLWLDLADAAAGLWRRRLRSGLSLLGIAIGVAALVAMLSIGEGAKREALAQIADMGLRTIRLESQPDPAQINRSQGLLQAEAERLAEWLGEAGWVGGHVLAESRSARYRHQQTEVMPVGATPDWLRAEQLVTSTGRLLTRADSEVRHQVCLLGHAVARDLLIRVGSWLQVGNRTCRVVGVLAPRGRLLTAGTDLTSLNFDRLVVWPLASFPWARWSGGRQVLDGLVIRLNTATEAGILASARQLANRLQYWHDGIRDYVLVVPLRLLQEARATERIFALVMGAIAGLSLLVGGIGVMNVMLANIAEQVREIGLRMAVGATRGRIVSLFLWHALLLTGSGGVLGLVAGLALAMLIQAWVAWPMAFSPPALVIGPAAAVLIGVLFGLHPAQRAASLQPALALREN